MPVTTRGAATLLVTLAAAAQGLMVPTPGLVVFDLDMCLWSPEMFELDGAPKTWAADTNTVRTSGRDVVRLFPGAVTALRELRSDPRFKNTKVAAASSTSHRDYAVRCLQMFEVEPGVKVRDVITYQEIYPSGKTKHFNKLHTATGVPFDQMLFFDDCLWGPNDREVERGCPGVVTVRTPDGLTEQKWRAGLDKFARAATSRSSVA